MSFWWLLIFMKIIIGCWLEDKVFQHLTSFVFVGNQSQSSLPMTRTKGKKQWLIGGLVTGAGYENIYRCQWYQPTEYQEMWCAREEDIHILMNSSLQGPNGHCLIDRHNLLSLQLQLQYQYIHCKNLENFILLWGVVNLHFKSLKSIYSEYSLMS